MNLKTVTYASLIVAGFFAGLIFPFVEMIGVGASMLLSALFLPVLGWKTIVKISIVLTCFATILSIPYLTGGYMQVQQTIEMGNKQIKNVPTNDTKIYIPEWVGSLVIPLTPILGFGQRIFLVWTTNKMIRKRGIYKIFSF